MNRRNFIASLLATGAVPMLAKAELPDLTNLIEEVGPELEKAVTGAYTEFGDIDWALVKKEAASSYQKELKVFQSAVGWVGSKAVSGPARQAGSIQFTSDDMRKTADFERAFGLQLGKEALQGQVSHQIAESAGNDFGVICMSSGEYFEQQKTAPSNGKSVAGSFIADRVLVNDHPALTDKTKSIHFKLARSISPEFYATTDMGKHNIIHRVQFEA